MESLNFIWTDQNGNYDGGISSGIGYTIAWQRGPTVPNGRNGAFLIDVLESCENQLKFHQNSRFACKENAEALEHLQKAIALLKQRKARRESEGTYGTNELDQQ